MIWIALIFTAGLWLLERRALAITTRDFEETMPPLALWLVQAGAFLATVVFFWASFSSTIWVRPVYFVLFLVACLLEYGYIIGMGRFSLMQDYLMGAEVIDGSLLMDDIRTFVVKEKVALVPLLSYAALLVLTAGNGSGGLGLLAAVLALHFGFYLLLYPFSIGSFRTLALGAAFRTLTFSLWRIIRRYRGPRQTVDLRAPAPPQNNVVLVVDESVRWDHLSLNGYERPTTPYLEELAQRGQLYNWGKAIAGTTFSLGSNLLLATGLRQLPDETQQMLRLPTVFDFAKAMGYENWVVDCQTDRRWLISKLTPGSYDHFIGDSALRDGPRYEIDNQGARKMHQVLSEGTGKFVFLNKMGLHFPYSVRYPADAERWQPVLPDAAYHVGMHDEIVNTYDNALAYNLDSFFRNLLEPGDLENTVIVYISDHGETLSDDGELWPHTGHTEKEVSVPLFIISPQRLEVDTAYRASYANIMPTLLDLLGVPEEARRYAYAPSLLRARAADSGPRWYIYGDLEAPRNCRVIEAP